MFDIMQSKGLALEGFPPYYTFHFPDHLLPWQYMLAFSSKFFQHHAPVQFFFPCLFIFFFFFYPPLVASQFFNSLVANVHNSERIFHHTTLTDLMAIMWQSNSYIGLNYMPF